MALFTAEQLNAQIAAYQSALLALATAEEYTIQLPDGSRQTVRRSALAELRKHLIWLNDELAKLDISSAAPAGRTFARNGGRG